MKKFGVNDLLTGLTDPFSWLGIALLWLIIYQFYAYHDEQRLRDHLCAHGLSTTGVVESVEVYRRRQDDTVSGYGFHYSYSVPESDKVYRGKVSQRQSCYDKNIFFAGETEKFSYKVGEIIPITYSPNNPGNHIPTVVTQSWVLENSHFPYQLCLFVPLIVILFLIPLPLGEKGGERIQVHDDGKRLSIKVENQTPWSQVFFLSYWILVWAGCGVGMAYFGCCQLDRVNIIMMLIVGFFGLVLIIIPLILALEKLLIILYGRKEILIAGDKMVESVKWGYFNYREEYNLCQLSCLRIHTRKLSPRIIFDSHLYIKEKSEEIPLFDEQDLTKSEALKVYNAMAPWFNQSPVSERTKTDYSMSGPLHKEPWESEDPLRIEESLKSFLPKI